MPLPFIIIPAAVAVVAFVFSLIRRNVRKKKFAGKKIMMFGPIASGKTTFMDLLTKGEAKKEPQPSANNEGYSEFYDEENDSYYHIFDMGGAPEYLVGGIGEMLYKNNDFILMFFDASKYLPASDNSRGLVVNNTMEYILDVNSRFEALATWYKKEKKPILIIGSHRDLLSESQQKQFSANLANGMDKSKEYYQFVCGQKFILANLNKKSDVAAVFKEIVNLKERE